MMRGARPTAVVSAASSSNSGSSTTASAAVAVPFEARRHSFRYLTKDWVESRQPQWLSQRKWGTSFQDMYVVSRNEHARTTLAPPQHPNVWAGDTTERLNPHFRAYYELYKPLNTLLGRRHSLTATNTSTYSDRLGAYELATDLRFRGADRSMIANIFYEPEWSKMRLDGSTENPLLAHQQRRAFGVAPASKAVAQEAQTVAHQLSREAVAAWWRELEKLIHRHRDAVGDYAPGSARNIRKVHEFFVHFNDAMTSFEFQDSFMGSYLFETKPATSGALSDLYGVFLEMEANRIVDTHCARCGQHRTETSFCGEGDAFSAFRQWRGRPVPHKPWAQEWLDAAAKRAEALWLRASEDPLFGNAGAAVVNPAQLEAGAGQENFYTQKQVEEMLRIYCLAKQRAKANSFMVNIMGSREYLAGAVKITDKMQAMYDALLDATPHPHMLTGANAAQPAAVGRYIPGLAGAPAATSGGSAPVPHSPVQMRIDMEVAKVRREQREEGVVRIPPQEWRVATEGIVGYRTDPATGRITNWAEVRASIERAYLASGLPQTAWLAHELREMVYLEDRIVRRLASEQHRAQIAAETERDRQLCREQPAKFKLFPDADAYRAFDAAKESIASFFTSSASAAAASFGHGEPFLLRAYTFPNPEAVPVTLGGRQMQLNVTDEMCRVYGDFCVGMKVQLDDGADTTAVILGVNVAESPAQWALMAVADGSASGAAARVLALGTDLTSVREQYPKLKQLGVGYPVPGLDELRTEPESFTGAVVGVRNGVLYAQLGGQGVAKPLGRKEVVSDARRYEFRPAPASQQQQQQGQGLREPHSWDVPFRNDQSEARLAELKKAPWMREEVAPLIPHGYTPKEKRFGYTQHITQDDFMTSEYRERLLARQYFSNAQKFRVIPDAVARAADFHGRLTTHNDAATGGPEGTVGATGGAHSARLQGFPSVDRRELDEGWAPVAPVPQWEVAAVEQALRDISGSRPGNYIRSPEEVASVDLPGESWWQRNRVHWQQYDEEDQFDHPARRRNLGLDPQKLPFGGQMPLAGSSMGIGDRLRDVLDDLRRGFDLGPSGHSPHSNSGAAAYDTLDAQARRSERLSAGDTLAALFSERLRADGLDAHTFVAGGGPTAGADPKALLIALNEWLRDGKPPALLLVRVLQRYLAADIAAFNNAVPDGAAKLSLDELTRNGVVSQALCSTSVWQHRRALPYRKQLLRETGSASNIGASSGAASQAQSHESWLMSFYIDQQTGAMLPSSDGALKQNAVEVLSAELMGRLRALVGKGINDNTMRAYQAVRGKQRSVALRERATTPEQLVLSREVADLLISIGVPTEQRELFMSALLEESARLAQRTDMNPRDFITTIPTVLSIGNIEKMRKSSGNSSSSPAASSAGGAMKESAANALRDAGAGASAAMLTNDAPMSAMIEKLTLLRDGYVADLMYAARENKMRQSVMEEFVRLAYAKEVAAANAAAAEGGSKKAVLLPSEAAVYKHFVAYCEGRWAPHTSEAVEMISTLLVTAANASIVGSKNAANNSAASSVEQLFAELGDSNVSFLVRGGSSASGAAAVVISDIEMLPLDRLHAGPFEFDNVVADRRTTLAHLSEWTPHRRSGPLHEYVPLLPDTLTASSASSSSSTSADGSQQQQVEQSFRYGVSPAYFTDDALHGLDTALRMAVKNLLRSDAPAGLQAGLLQLADDSRALSRIANRVLNRCFPLLKRWYDAVVQLHDAEGQTARIIHSNAVALNSLNRAVADPQQEADFRANAERYWRRVIESGGTSAGGGSLVGGDRQQGGGMGGGGGGGRGQEQQQISPERRAQNQRDFRNLAERAATTAAAGGFARPPSPQQQQQQQDQQGRSPSPTRRPGGAPNTGGGRPSSPSAMRPGGSGGGNNAGTRGTRTGGSGSPTRK